MNTIIIISTNGIDRNQHTVAELTAAAIVEILNTYDTVTRVWVNGVEIEHAPTADYGADVTIEASMAEAAGDFYTKYIAAGSDYMWTRFNEERNELPFSSAFLAEQEDAYNEFAVEFEAELETENE